MRYSAILIDADDTLFDFQIAERNAIGEVLLALDVLDENAPHAYHEINDACWLDFERGAITQAELQERRFAELLELYSLRSVTPTQAAEMFADALSRQTVMIEGALESVRRIAAVLPIAIVTNGVARIQHGRMGRSPLKQLVSALVISEEVGCAKPDSRMIESALRALGGVAPDRALMVGDSLTSDMRCALNAGTDSCWYNPARKTCPEDMALTYEIHDIRALPDIALQ